MRDFDTLSQKEILALAVSLEEEDERIYSDFSESLRENFPGTAQVFEEMRQEEIGHRRRLIDLYKQKFGEHIPLIRRQDVRGFVHRKPIWLAASTSALRRTRRTRASVSCLTTWRRRRLLTSSALRSWRKLSSSRRSARKKTRRNAGSSSCRLCSPASQA
jgi:hypothetical protein